MTMGNRLSRIVTRTGDRGQTGLGNGMRVEKNSPLIETLGGVDELNSWIGVLITLSRSDQVKEILTLVQHDLFDLGAQLSVPGTPLMSLEHVARIEERLSRLNGELGPLKEFILPGGALSSGIAHVARTVCRRAERQLVGLIELVSMTIESGATPRNDPLPPDYGLIYLNRLSDLLFVVSRIENRVDGRGDIFWERGKSLGK
jgi:cob(I)alamin adenosyltransferase